MPHAGTRSKNTGKTDTFKEVKLHDGVVRGGGQEGGLAQGVLFFTSSAVSTSGLWSRSVWVKVFQRFSSEVQATTKFCLKINLKNKAEMQIIQKMSFFQTTIFTAWMTIIWDLVIIQLSEMSI